MSEEVFPTRYVPAASFINVPIDGWIWTFTERSFWFLHEPHRVGAVVWIGNEKHKAHRGYKHDAVWFEFFGQNLASKAVARFAEVVGSKLGCPLVSEYGELMDGEGTYDRALIDRMVEAMQREPGSIERGAGATTRIGLGK